MEDSASESNRNTLNDSDLGHETGRIEDYFFNFDEKIEARYLYYNSYITRGASTIDQPKLLDPYQDTLNFRTFPYYIAVVEGSPADTVSYLLSLTPENIDAYSTMFPLDELNTANQNWCNELLVEYAGDCPDTVEVDFDYQINPLTVTGTEEDTDISAAKFLDMISVKDTTFTTDWTDINSLVWDNALERYSVVTDSIVHILDTTITNSDDTFDSLIYIAVIDTSRFPVTDLMFIDRAEWERYDIVTKSDDFPYVLSDTFRYNQILLSDDAPIYRINGDCNQNLQWDTEEKYYDFGADWCPDSLETGEGKCTVVDTNEDDSLFDEIPCNCLGDWRSEEVVNPVWVEGSNADPNGDNWRDCGWDGICPGDNNYESADPNDTESNGVWDNYEGFEENGQYNYDIISSTGEYFDDAGNGVENEPPEYYTDNNENNEYDFDEPFEDRNCNGEWDNQEDGDAGNGVWDDNEGFILNDDGDTLLYTLSDKLETYTVDYTDPDNPKPVTSLALGDSITLYYGTYADSIHVKYTNILKETEIVEPHSASYRDIITKTTIYTNKIVESPLSGEADDYYITKTEWYQEENSVPVDAYDYHLFKIADNGAIHKMVHSAFFNYYGYYQTWNEFEDGSWKTVLAEEETYIYSANGELRSGEFYYHDTTLVTRVAQYYIQDQYEVEFDSEVSVPFAQVTHEGLETDGIVCINDPDTTGVGKLVYPPYNCPPVDTTLTNTFKITKTRTMTMIGSGVEFGYRNTIWVGRDDAANKPLGIVKDQLEIRWGEPYWEKYGSDWEPISSLELVSLHTSDSGSNLLRNILQPSKRITTNQFKEKGEFNYDPYVISPTVGLHRLKVPHEE